jgi:Lon protease-like protein
MASAAGSAIVPIFPLPDVTFFPRTLLPLHVFEARYRAMVMDALARDRRLCVVKLRQQSGDPCERGRYRCGSVDTGIGSRDKSDFSQDYYGAVAGS